ncbi:MAG TPA: hypothetical protein VM487_13850, partial [Phycisphaerae bacterium]|nr:hypothetical protein [Phycisphaerae bacterium]
MGERSDLLDDLSREVSMLRSQRAILHAIGVVLTEMGYPPQNERSGEGWGAADVRAIVQRIKSENAELRARVRVADERVRVLEKERGDILRGLRHPIAPHVDALLNARVTLCEHRDAGCKFAAAAIGRIDVALDCLAYKHFTVGGDRHDS